MRADRFLYLTGKFQSRNKAAEYLEQGRVLVNGKRVKPSFDMDEYDEIELIEEGFLSNGGYKLETAVKLFDLSLADAVCIDVGASTGGFTDCMLRFGARKVYAVDVGENQLAPALASDERVVVMDNVNARTLHPAMFGEAPDFVTCDVSFISLELVLPALFSLCGPETVCVVLVKPQFEAGRGNLGKNGIVKDPAVRLVVLERIFDFVTAAEFSVLGCGQAFKRDPGMNSEYVLALSRGAKSAFCREDLRRVVENN